MNKRITWLLACVLALPATAQEAPDTGPESVWRECDANRKSRCWLPGAQRLAQLAQPNSSNEREERIFSYLLLAKTAQSFGDLADANSFFVRALELARGLLENKDDRPTAGIMSAMLGAERAQVFILMNNHAAALSALDAFDAVKPRTPGRAVKPDSYALLRCAALIGLQRKRDANVCLYAIEQGLDFEDAPPIDGFPFGPQVLNPYETARRIAAYRLRNGQYRQAQALLESIEGKRKSIIERAAEPGSLRRAWADTVSAEVIIADIATAYLMQGKDRPAEPLLHAVLQVRENVSNADLQNVLIQLAALNRRAGRIAEADKLDLRASALTWEKEWLPPDPLASTLGFASWPAKTK